MSESRIDQLLEAVDRLDVDAMVALMARDCRFLTADGRGAQGIDAARELLTDFVGTLRSTTHRVTSQWREDDVWIAEVEATYVLQDWLEANDLRRAFFVQDGPEGITAVRVYGAHERPLTDHPTGDEGLRIGERWIPPL